MSTNVEQIISSIRQLPPIERERLRRMLDHEISDARHPKANGADRPSKSLLWLSKNRDEYIGQWVSLDGDQLIASGSSARDVFDQAKAEGIESPFVEFVTNDPSPFTGGWLS